MMRLVTKEIERGFRKVGRQGSVKDPVVVCKFFNPSGGGTWYATELHYMVRKPNGDIAEIEASRMNGSEGRVIDMNFYGYVSIFGDHCDEWGYFSLSELQSVKGPFGLGIERDKFFDPQPISKACPKALL